MMMEDEQAGALEVWHAGLVGAEVARHSNAPFCEAGTVAPGVQVLQIKHLIEGANQCCARSRNVCLEFLHAERCMSNRFRGFVGDHLFPIAFTTKGHKGCVHCGERPSSVTITSSQERFARRQPPDRYQDVRCRGRRRAAWRGKSLARRLSRWHSR